MEHDLLKLLDAREGHFRLESGYHGGLWLDLDPLFVWSPRIRPFVEELGDRLSRHGIEAVCGPLVGGAFLAQTLASVLGVEFYYTERFTPQVRNMPWFTPPAFDTLFPVEYRLPASVRGMVADKAVAVVDDAISAGSAVRGTFAALESCGARSVAIGALLVMGGSAEHFCSEHGVALEYIAQLPYDIWPRSECPLCAIGVPLEDKMAG